MARLDEVMRGLQILARYTKPGTANTFAAEHDTIYAGPKFGSESDIAAEDRVELERLGWLFDKEILTWFRFV